jgi:hypothetical protein
MEVPGRHDTELDVKARDLAEHYRRAAGGGKEWFCMGLTDIGLSQRMLSS